MKKILLISLSILIAGEMEVDGDLNVSGDIQSPTIEVLLLQITELQEQLILLQTQVNASQGTDNQLETRVYELPISHLEAFNISNITGYNLDYFLLEIVNATPSSEIGGSVDLSIKDNNFGSYRGEARGTYYGYNLDTYYFAGALNRGLFLHPEDLIFQGPGNWNIKVAVTAQFSADSAINSKNNKEIK